MNAAEREDQLDNWIFHSGRLNDASYDKYFIEPKDKNGLGHIILLYKQT